MSPHEDRVRRLQDRLAREGRGTFVIEDADSLLYFSGAGGHLGMEYGRATLLIVPVAGEPTLITPRMEAEMLADMTWITDVRGWDDGEGREWVDALSPLLPRPGTGSVALELRKTNPVVTAAVTELAGPERVADGSRFVDEMRMVKDAGEIETMRLAGRIGTAMMTAARDSLGEGVPEYETWLAASAAGSRKAAEFLGEENAAYFFSPLIQGFPPIQSGHHTSMVHRRASTRRIGRGEPVYFCFCGLVKYQGVKLGFDRQFFVGEVDDEIARMAETALAAQEKALGSIRPGVRAEDVHLEAEQAYRDAGFEPSYRTGRGVGHSLLEPPELKRGDGTRLEIGMTFAVDGGVTVAGTGGGRVGDSVVVTENGFEYLTAFPKGILLV